MQQNRMSERKAMVAVTRELARYAVGSRFEDLPEAVRHEGERAFVNILGCVLGGAKADGVDRLLAASPADPAWAKRPSSTRFFASWPPRASAYRCALRRAEPPSG